MPRISYSMFPDFGDLGGVLLVDVSLYSNTKFKIRHIARESSVYILYHLKHAKLCIVIKHQKGGD
jgi:hypothetical protein